MTERVHDGPNPVPPEDRFWQKVDQGSPEDCWEWTASRKDSEYGWFSFEGEAIHAHRAAYILEVEDPGVLNVLHHCDNPPCVNPNHLYAGDQSDNTQDAYDRGRKEAPALEGEANGLSKLTEQEVRQIRRRYNEGGVTQAQLGDEYGISQQNVSHIVRREWWDHVE